MLKCTTLTETRATQIRGICCGAVEAATSKLVSYCGAQELDGLLASSTLTSKEPDPSASGLLRCRG
jgi:hypothetical protein